MDNTAGTATNGSGGQGGNNGGMSSGDSGGTQNSAGSSGAIGGSTQDEAGGAGGTHNPSAGAGGEGNLGGATASGAGGTHNPSAGAGGEGNLGGATASGAGGISGAGGSGGSAPSDCSRLLLDDFESTNGAWYAWKDAGDPGKVTMQREASDRDGMALHAAIDNVKAAMGSIQLSLAALNPSSFCPDLPTTTGLKFWAKGSQTVRVTALTRDVLPPENGGKCTDPEACWSNHGYDLKLSNEWKEYKLPWSAFTQTNPITPTPFDKTELIHVTFTNLKDGSSEFWIDDVSLADTPIDVPNDKGEPTCTVAKYMSADDFDTWFPARNSLYQFESGLCEAIKRYWRSFTYKFANSGDADTDKREIAAFFAHVRKETVGLQVTTEAAATAPPYQGRGPLQLTHESNYRAAGNMMGIDLQNDPNRVATDPVVTWGAALWLWIMEKGAGSMTPNEAMVEEGGGRFIETLRALTGALEGCSGSHAQERANYYIDFCTRLGVTVGGPTTC